MPSVREARAGGRPGAPAYACMPWPRIRITHPPSSLVVPPAALPCGCRGARPSSCHCHFPASATPKPHLLAWCPEPSPPARPGLLWREHFARWRPPTGPHRQRLARRLPLSLSILPPLAGGGRLPRTLLRRPLALAPPVTWFWARHWPQGRSTSAFRLAFRQPGGGLVSRPACCTSCVRAPVEACFLAAPCRRDAFALAAVYPYAWVRGRASGARRAGSCCGEDNSSRRRASPRARSGGRRRRPVPAGSPAWPVDTSRGLDLASAALAV
jgi:hypothetical protein